MFREDAQEVIAACVPRFHPGGSLLICLPLLSSLLAQQNYRLIDPLFQLEAAVIIVSRR